MKLGKNWNLWIYKVVVKWESIETLLNITRPASRKSYVIGFILPKITWNTDQKWN